MDEIESGPGDDPFDETNELNDIPHTGGLKPGADSIPLADPEKLLECPDCEEVLDDATGDGPAAVDEGDIRVPIDCPSCGAKLTLIVESALPDASDAHLSVEHRG